MKKGFLVCLILSSLLLQSCSQSDCDCWENAFKEESQSYTSAVSEMENAFVAKGYLKNTSTDSYLELIDSIILKNEYDLFFSDFNPILRSKFIACFTRKKCDKTIYNKIQALNKKLGEYDNISPSIAFKDLKNTFTKEEFESPEVKHYCLNFYTAFFL